MAKLMQISIEDAQSRMAKRTRSSKWRNFLDEFIAADIDAAEVELEEGEQAGSVASGLNNVLRTSRENGKEYPVEVSLRTVQGGGKAVLILRSDRVDATEVSDEE